MLRRFLTNYVERHRHPANQVLHAIGLPLTFVVSVVCLIEQQWWWAAAAFAGGYTLQFLGHAIEGNDAGELILVKRLLGKPYVEFGPRSPLAAAPAPAPVEPQPGRTQDLAGAAGSGASAHAPEGPKPAQSKQSSPAD